MQLSNFNDFVDPSKLINFPLFTLVKKYNMNTVEKCLILPRLSFMKIKHPETNYVWRVQIYMTAEENGFIHQLSCTMANYFVLNIGHVTVVNIKRYIYYESSYIIRRVLKFIAETRKKKSYYLIVYLRLISDYIEFHWISRGFLHSCFFLLLLFTPIYKKNIHLHIILFQLLFYYFLFSKLFSGLV